METREVFGGRVEISTDSAHVLRRKGQPVQPDLRRLRVAADEVGQWEELTVAEAEEELRAAENDERYRRMVSDGIRRRYDLDAELAILRQRDDKPEEFAAYSAYAEECKAEARAEVDAQRTMYEAQSTDGSDVINAQCIMHNAQLSDISEVSEEGIGDE